MTMTCVRKDCERPTRCRDLCSNHYAQLTRRPDFVSQNTPTGPYCDCRQPVWESVCMFGWVTLTDVHQCSTCHRPPKPT